MSGRPRTTSFAEANKQQPNLVLGGVKISSKYSALHYSDRQIYIVHWESTVDGAGGRQYIRLCM